MTTHTKAVIATIVLIIVIIGLIVMFPMFPNTIGIFFVLVGIFILIGGFTIVTYNLFLEFFRD